MVLRHKLRDRGAALGMGQFCLAAGVLLSRLSRAGLPPAVTGVLSGDWLSGALQGFATVLLGCSIWLNVRALRRS